MKTKNTLEDMLEDLQKFVVAKQILKSEGLDNEEKTNLFIDLTEASALVAGRIERELRAEFERLLRA